MAGTYQKRQVNKKAIVLIHFGTTVPSALNSLDITKTAIKDAFPNIHLTISFTSNIIRGIWAKRRVEEQVWLDQGVPSEVLYARSVLGTIGDLQDRGFRSIIAQPTYIAHGEQYEDLRSYINGLQLIRTIKQRWMPFEKIVCSRPVLGTHGIEFDYKKDIREAVSALKTDIEKAKEYDADLVYVGHGNKYFSTGVHLETQQELRRQYPEISSFVGLVEGFPKMEELLPDIKKVCRKNILLKPFMLTAGEHTHKDIAGDDENSWKTRLEKLGFNVIPVLEGLGSNKEFAGIFPNRIQQTAEFHGIDLSQPE